MEHLFEIRFNAADDQATDLDQQMKILASLKNSHNEIAYVSPNGTVLNISTEYNHFILRKNDKSPERFPYGLEDQLLKRLKENLKAFDSTLLPLENEYKLVGPEELLKVTAHLNDTDTHQFESENEYKQRIKDIAYEERKGYRKSLGIRLGSITGGAMSLITSGAFFKIIVADLSAATLVSPLALLNVPFSQGALGLFIGGGAIAIGIYRNKCTKLQTTAENLVKAGKTLEKFIERVQIADYESLPNLDQVQSDSILDQITVRPSSSNNNEAQGGEAG